jgi:hypothetical protein
VVVWLAHNWVENFWRTLGEFLKDSFAALRLLSAATGEKLWRLRLSKALLTLILVPLYRAEQQKATQITESLCWMKRKIQLTVETHQMLVISKATGSTQGWCSECARNVPLIKPEEAAVLASVSSRTIYAWVETGYVHFVETVEEGPRICLDSLLNQMRM